MSKLWNSVAFRLALFCGVVVIVSALQSSIVFYYRTVGVLERETDSKLLSISGRLTDVAERKGVQTAAARIEMALNDGVDSDTEIYLLTDAAGRKLIGNIAVLDRQRVPSELVLTMPVLRNDRPSTGRLYAHQLSSGGLLVVGRDMSDRNEIRQLVGKAIWTSTALALLLALGGTLIFRRQIEKRVWQIRHAALDIEAGNLSRRIAISTTPDEFDRLGADINRMLDRIEHLMDGVRHVSNIAAHNLRTPLGRIRGKLDEAVRAGRDQEQLVDSVQHAIGEIDRLTQIFNSLIQIAESESSTRRQPFLPVDLHEVTLNLLELYDAVAEEQGMTLTSALDENARVLGDKDLLAEILASLLDNALKYAGNAATITVRLQCEANKVVLIVEDNGPGIPADEFENVLQRFYRLSTDKEGNGLGLSIVAAFTRLHDGELYLEDAAPGLRVRIVLPAAEIATFPNGNELAI